MAFETIIKPIVWFDLDEAITWYENESEGLGMAFFKGFEEAKEKIESNPTVYRNIFPDIKRILLNKFPYKLFYTISGNKIAIIGLTHAKRSNAFVRKPLKEL